MVAIFLLNWECHIENISKKIACAIGAIKRIRHLTPFNVLIKVSDNSLVQLHFDYCNLVWCNCNKGLLEKLQRLQNRTACTLMSASYDSNLYDLFRALRRRLYYRKLDRKFHLMYKTLNGMTSDYLRSRFLYRDNVNAYRLRNTENKLVLPQPRTDYLKRSFSYSGTTYL